MAGVEPVQTYRMTPIAVRLAAWPGESLTARHLEAVAQCFSAMNVNTRTADEDYLSAQKGQRRATVESSAHFPLDSMCAEGRCITYIFVGVGNKRRWRSHFWVWSRE